MKEYTKVDEDKLPENRCGYPCPVCGGAVHITLYQLLEGKHVFCPECGFRINFDAQPAKDKCK